MSLPKLALKFIFEGLRRRDKAVLTLVSATSIVEGGAHDVIQKDKSGTIK